MEHAHNPVLIFTWGNPSRGDDAIGPCIHDRLQAADLAGVDLLTDYQLQIENALDLESRERILFVDASASAQAPFEFSTLQPDRDSSYTTHAMSPGALLSVFTQVNGQQPPPAFMLSVRGYEFGLGLPISGEAKRNTEMAYSFIIDLLKSESSGDWQARNMS